MLLIINFLLCDQFSGLEMGSLEYRLDIIILQALQLLSDSTPFLCKWSVDDGGGGLSVSVFVNREFTT